MNGGSPHKYLVFGFSLGKTCYDLDSIVTSNVLKFSESEILGKVIFYFQSFQWCNILDNVVFLRFLFLFLLFCNLLNPNRQLSSFYTSPLFFFFSVFLDHIHFLNNKFSYYLRGLNIYRIKRSLATLAFCAKCSYSCFFFIIIILIC